MNVANSTTLTVNQNTVSTFTGILSLGTSSGLVIAGPGNGALTIGSAPTFKNGSSLTINAGTLQIDATGSTSAMVGTGVTASVAGGATLQLAGTVSALSNSTGSNAANVVTRGNGALFVTGTNQTVGSVTGDARGNGYTGSTTVGNGTNAASLIATQILQSTLIINANSTVMILPSNGTSQASGASAETNGASAIANSATAAAYNAANSASGSSNGRDAFAAIEAALASSSTQQLAITTLRDFVLSDPGMRLSPIDDVSLYHDYQLASNGVPLMATNSGAASTPTLAFDLAADGLTPSEITSLVGSGSLAGDSGITDTLEVGENSFASLSQVPEPATLVLAALGSIALCFAGRCRNRRIAIARRSAFPDERNRRPVVQSHEKALRRAWLAILGMVFFGVLAGPISTVRGASADDKLFAEAAARIEQNRKADAVVVVVDRAGKPIPAADVAIEQTRHAFLFGCNIFLWGKTGNEKAEAAYRAQFANVFNYATLPFFWNTYEPKRGQTDQRITSGSKEWPDGVAHTASRAKGRRSLGTTPEVLTI